MNTLSSHDLSWIVRRLPKKLKDGMQLLGPKVVVAGGFIRCCIANEPINDVDVFTQTPEEAETIAKTLLPTGRSIISTDNAYTIKGLGIPIQFIHRWTFPKPEDSLKSFDFTIAMAAIWFDGFWRSACDPRFYEDLAAKRLVYTSPERNEDAGGSMLRVLKFYQRGYRIPLDSLGAVIARLTRDIEDDGVRNIQGARKCTFEKARAHVISTLLFEVDPLLDPEHCAHMPSLEEPEPEKTDA